MLTETPTGLPGEAPAVDAIHLGQYGVTPANQVPGFRYPVTPESMQGLVYTQHKCPRILPCNFQSALSGPTTGIQYHVLQAGVAPLLIELLKNSAASIRDWFPVCRAGMSLKDFVQADVGSRLAAGYRAGWISHGIFRRGERH